MLLKKYKKILLEEIEKCKLDPLLFSANENTEDDYSVFVITFLPIEINFTIKVDLDGFHSFKYKYDYFSPSSKSTTYHPPESVHRNQWCDFSEVCKEFNGWLFKNIQEYITEISIPDVWAEIESQRALLINSEVNEESPEYFTEEEKNQIQLGLGAFKNRLIEEFKPTDKQLDNIEKRVDYLLVGLNRLNRIDWKAILISQVLGISYTLALNSEQSRVVIELLLQALSTIGYFLKP